MRPLLWIFAGCIALAAFRMVVFAGVVVLGIGLLAAAAKAPRETLGFLGGLLLLGLFAHRPEIGLAMFGLLIAANHLAKN